MTQSYIYGVFKYDGEWKVYKNGVHPEARAVSTHRTKRQAINEAARLAEGNAHAVVVNKKSNEFASLTPYSVARSVKGALWLELDWVDYGEEPGWWLSFAGPDTSRSITRFPRKNAGKETGEDLMEVIGAGKFIIKNQSNSGRAVKRNSSMSEPGVI